MGLIVGGGGVELSSASVEMSQQSLLVFLECWSIFAMGDGRIMGMDRASLLLAIGFGHQCQCQCLVVAVVVQKTAITTM